MAGTFGVSMGLAYRAGLLEAALFMISCDVIPDGMTVREYAKTMIKKAEEAEKEEMAKWD